MRVLYFSQLKTVTGCDAEHLDLREPITQTQFWKRLISLHPGLAGHREIVRLAKNEEYATGADLFTNDDEVALIPPVSGG